MDELIKSNSFDFSNIAVPTLIDFIIGYFIAIFCALIISYAYRKTHSGYSFSSSFMISMILVSVIICLIMIIIGSNIARAFALVGAMSIVRFRNPVKETRDLVYVFACIAVGMAAGTGFYLAAIVFSVLFLLTCLIFDRSSFFEANSFVHILAINGNENDKKNFEMIIKDKVKQMTLLTMSSTLTQDQPGEFVYEIELEKADHFQILKDTLASDPSIPPFRIIYGNSIISS